MSTEIVVSSNPFSTRIARIREGELIRYNVSVSDEDVGNIYKGVARNIVPSMEAAFIDIGLEKDAFLCTSDLYITPDDFYLFALSHYDEERFLKFKKDSFGRPVHIKDVIQKGQSVIVQVVRPQSRDKGPRVSTYLTIPGRYIALLPKSTNIGVSKKIKNPEKRRALYKLLEKYQEDDIGMIARTASADATENQIIEDIRDCLRIYRYTKTAAIDNPAPTLLYRENNFVIRELRDNIKPIDTIVVDDSSVFRQISSLSWINAKIKMYSDPEPVFDVYGISKKIPELYARKLLLKSGGSIIIEETEALVAIDVNSGKTVGKSLEEMIFMTNMEAAELIAMQVKLRNLGGIIIIDFIDMADNGHKQSVVEHLKEQMTDDRLKYRVNEISTLGLVEMTRKRTFGSLSEITGMQCPICNGSGRLKSPESIASDIFEEIRRLVLFNSHQNLYVEAAVPVAKLVSSLKIKNVIVKSNDKWKEKYSVRLTEAKKPA